MKKPFIIILFLNLFLLQFTYAQFYISEKKVSEDKISKNVLAYVNENYEGSSVKYYKVKTDQDATLYEAKIKLNEEKTTLIFSNKGEFMTIDNEVYYGDVPEEIRKIINSKLSSDFSKFKVTHCRDQNIESRKVYELDVIAKKKRYKFRFEHSGTFIDFKEVPQKNIALIFH